MTFDVKACGARIRELRMKNGLTQETLAEDLNITDVHLRRIESGVRGGSIELLIELCERGFPEGKSLSGKMRDPVQCHDRRLYGFHLR